MPNGDDKAFNAMNAIIATDEVDLTEDGEVSAWFPTGKFLGMKVPKGIAGIIEGLVFLAAGKIPAKAAKTAANYIEQQMAFLSPKMQKVAVSKATDFYAKEVSSIIKSSWGSPQLKQLAPAKKKALVDITARYQSKPQQTLSQAVVNSKELRVEASKILKPEAAKSFAKASTSQKYLREFGDSFYKYPQAPMARKVGITGKPGLKAAGRFSIPYVLDEFE